MLGVLSNEATFSTVSLDPAPLKYTYTAIKLLLSDPGVLREKIALFFF